MKILFSTTLIFFLNIFLIAETPEKVLQKIEDLLEDVPSGTKTAIMIYNPLTEDTILSINPTEEMIPASNTKLFTSAVALDLMGGDYLLSTKILSGDNDLSDGTIDGD
ncbi:MAG: D-alanyl-D-alanine carboxypeptidase, partial [Ignavibacteriaceae bacterium]